MTSSVLGSGTELSSVNPTDGSELDRYACMAVPQVDAVLDEVTAGQRRWSRLGVADRAAGLGLLAEALRRESSSLAALITAEMGKPLAEATGEVRKCAAVCDYYRDHAAELLADVEVPIDGVTGVVTSQPLGTVLAVMPWNFPFMQVFRAAVPALVAGNAVLLKHAENVTGCALAIQRLITKHWLPEPVFRTLVVERDAVAGIIADPRVHGVTLTGSDRAGAQVAATAGAHLKKTVLELGGSDPFIVLDDADLDAAVAGAARSRFWNAGQTCISAKRFLVADDVADAFEGRLADAIAELRVGDPVDPATEVGPLARPDLRTSLHRQVERSVEAGARLRLGGEPLDRPGNFYRPTLLLDVKPGMPVFDEETFGPVAAVCRVSSADEAVTIANDSAFGLAGSVWTRDPDRARLLAGRLEVGAVFVNETPRTDPRLPFGGVKRSGYGRASSAKPASRSSPTSRPSAGREPGPTDHANEKEVAMVSTVDRSAAAAEVSMQDLLGLRDRVVPRGVSTGNPLVIDRAEGARWVDADGAEWIDFTGGIGVLNVGAGHPQVRAAVHAQVDQLIHTCSHVAWNEPYLRVAERLAELAPVAAPAKTLLLNSGAEANENAVKIARAATGRELVVYFDGAFHGRTLLTMSITGVDRPYKDGSGPFVGETRRVALWECVRCPVGRRGEGGCEHGLETLQELLEREGDRVAAVVIEPVIGQGGFFVPPTDFLRRTAELTRKAGALLVADEVLTGFGRTGRMFASERLGLMPDLITLGKPMAGGFPLSAVVGPAEVMDAAPTGSLGGTQGGNPVSCAAALAVLDLLADGTLIERAEEIGATALRRMRSWQESIPAVGDVRGLGAMVAMELVTPSGGPDTALARRVQDGCVRRNLVTVNAGFHGTVARLLFPLTIDDDTLDEGLSRLGSALAEAASAE